MGAALNSVPKRGDPALENYPKKGSVGLQSPFQNRDPYQPAIFELGLPPNIDASL